MYDLEEIAPTNDISDKLLNDWIENKLSLNQSEFFAQKFINVGFDSFKMIENIS